MLEAWDVIFSSMNFCSLKLFAALPYCVYLALQRRLPLFCLSKGCFDRGLPNALSVEFFWQGNGYRPLFKVASAVRLVRVTPGEFNFNTKPFWGVLSMCLAKAHLVTITLDRRGIKRARTLPVCNPTSILTGKAQPGREGILFWLRLGLGKKASPKPQKKPSCKPVRANLIRRSVYVLRRAYKDTYLHTILYIQ